MSATVEFGWNSGPLEFRKTVFSVAVSACLLSSGPQISIWKLRYWITPLSRVIIRIFPESEYSWEVFWEAGEPFLTGQQLVLELSGPLNSQLLGLTLFSVTIGMFPSHKMNLSIILA